MTQNIIIALHGFRKSGKTETYKRLNEFVETEKVSFANNLKRGVAEFFGWEFELLEGETEESLVWREQVDEYWTEHLAGKPGVFQDLDVITPRNVMQYMGNEVMKKSVHPSFWVLSANKRLDSLLRSSTKPIVITDLRFPQEADRLLELRELGIAKVLIVRLDRREVVPVNITHSSDLPLAEHYIDYVLDNNHGIDELRDRIREMYDSKIKDWMDQIERSM